MSRVHGATGPVSPVSVIIGGWPVDAARLITVILFRAALFCPPLICSIDYAPPLE